MSLLLNALLGDKNPLSQWASTNSNTLTGLGASLLNDGMNFTPLQQGKAADLEVARQKDEDAKKLAQNEQFKAWLGKTRPDLVPLLDAGVSSGDMFAQVMKPQDKGSGLINAGGGSIYNPNTGEWIRDPNAAAGGGTYDGTSMDAQNWNILLGGDPSTPQYAAAWAQLTAPKMTLKETANGVVPVYETPEIPSSIRRPTGMGGPGAPPQAAPQSAAPQAWGASRPFGSAAAPASPNAALPGPAVGAPIPGTKAKPTESQLRNTAISTVLTSEVPKVGNNFKALTDPKGQLLSVLGAAGNPWQSAQYQQAASALGSSISQVLYSLSGATANPGEVQKQTEFLTPAFGDKPEVIADKLDRFKTLVRAVAANSGDPEVKQMVETAIANLDTGAAASGPAIDPISAADALLKSGKY